MDREVTPYIDVLVAGVHDGRFAIDYAARSISSQCPVLRPDPLLEDTHDIHSFDAIFLRDLGHVLLHIDDHAGDLDGIHHRS